VINRSLDDVLDRNSGKLEKYRVGLTLQSLSNGVAHGLVRARVPFRTRTQVTSDCSSLTLMSDRLHVHLIQALLRSFKTSFPTIMLTSLFDDRLPATEPCYRLDWIVKAGIFYHTAVSIKCASQGEDPAYSTFSTCIFMLYARNTCCADVPAEC
jgi:hypothetical protein